MVARGLSALSLLAAQLTTFALCCSLVIMAIAGLWMVGEGAYYFVLYLLGG